MTEKPAEVEDLRGPIRELREYARGELDVDHQDVHPYAGLVEDPDIRDVLAFMAEEYEPVGDMPRDFWETKFAKRIMKRLGSETASKAVEQGDANRAAYMTGVPSYESDVSGIHAINRLTEWLVHSEQCKLVYMAALMGRGKTDLSLTFLEIVADHYQRIDKATDEPTPTPEFATNFWVDTPEDVDHVEITSWPELQEWAETGSSDDVRWFVFDEASTELTAQSGKNAQDVAETMGPFVKKMRKCGINMIVIGHDRRDVHPAIRSMADFVDKTGLKSASIYEGIKRREPTGHLFDVDGIPPTSWRYDTDDMAEWSWGDEEDELEEETISEDDLRRERDERIARLYATTDLTYADLADAFDVSRTTVKRAVDAVEVGESGDVTAAAD